MMILIGFAPNPANPRKILWWLCCYAWWPDEFLGNFSPTLKILECATGTQADAIRKLRSDVYKLIGR
ncbi:MAG: hypothetical protein CG442_1168 [Methylococcaceae bacterium NSO1]|nr:MAG: hypothetical protein CG442_1168 [Methylococcaceae bacterium NSO1]